MRRRTSAVIAPPQMNPVHSIAMTIWRWIKLNKRCAGRAQLLLSRACRTALGGLRRAQSSRSLHPFTHLFALVLLVCVQPVRAQTVPAFHAWAPAPPMGWNSWDCFGAGVNQEQTLANADYIDRHLK